MRLSDTHLLADESGQAVVEYGTLLALIVVGALVFVPGVGDAVTSMYQGVRDSLLAVLP
jgi:Flp pilus assembly pilin Flp